MADLADWAPLDIEYRKLACLSVRGQRIAPPRRWITTLIAIIDYDVGNLAAVANMLTRIKIKSEITRDPEKIRAASRIILPGNGAFDACMQNLRATGLIPLLEQKVLEEKTPLLGICVGAQMLGTQSEEGEEPGLGWMDMSVKRFPTSPRLPVPHMGWNGVAVRNPHHALMRDLKPDSRFYFVHSYYLAPADPRAVILSAEYGFEFAAGVAQGNIAGVQFHPEKSHRFGKALLTAFASDS